MATQMEQLASLFDVPMDTPFCIGNGVKEQEKRGVLKQEPLIITNGPYCFTEKGLLNVMGNSCPDVLGNLCIGRFYVERRKEVMDKHNQEGYTGGKDLPNEERLRKIADLLHVSIDVPLSLESDKDNNVYFLTEKGLMKKGAVYGNAVDGNLFPCTYLYGEVLMGKEKLYGKRSLRRNPVKNICRMTQENVERGMV